MWLTPQELSKQLWSTWSGSEGCPNRRWAGWGQRRREVAGVSLGERCPQAIHGRRQLRHRPQPYSALELGLGLAGLIGGAYGVRVVRTIKQLRDKSQALKEIVSGNEYLRQQHPEMKTFFKEAHQHQSVGTRAIVAEMTP